MKNTASKITIAAITVIVLGWCLTWIVVPYGYEFSAEKNDDSITYHLSSDRTSDASVVLIETDGKYDLNNLIILKDDEYYSFNNEEDLDYAVKTLQNRLSKYSFGTVTIGNADCVLSAIAEKDVKHTVLMFITGAYPDVIYDGTETCPLVDWLNAGGAMINTFGVLGKYIAHGPHETDCQTVEGYASIFTNLDDAAFRDPQQTCDGNAIGTAFTNHSLDQIFTEPLHISFSEYTYGIKTSSLEHCINLGYTSEDGYSCVSLFESRGGMVMNFGMSAEYSSYAVTQLDTVLSAGLDYSAEISDWDHGMTDMDGIFEIKPSKNYHVFGYIGSSNPLFGQKIMM